MSERSQQPGTPFTAVTGAWARMAGGVVRSAVAANRATAAVFGATDGGDREVDEETRPGSVSSVAFEELDWTFERSESERAALSVGDTVTFSKLIEDDDVHAFARASGDTNRLHLDDEFAGRTRFGGRIVHGTLASGLISAALARLPGLTIYLSQNLDFSRPIRIGDRVTATVEIVEDLGDHQYRLRTTVTDDDQDELIIDGEATVLIDELPAE